MRLKQIIVKFMGINIDEENNVLHTHVDVDEPMSCSRSVDIQDLSIVSAL